MMTNGSPSASRVSLSSSSNLSKTTALDIPHTAKDLLHHAHKHSVDTMVDSIKDAKYAMNNEVPSEPIQSFSMSPCDDDEDNSIDPEKGHTKRRRSLSQLPGDVDGQTDHGLTCTWADLPQWMRDNPAILTGYRRATYSYQKCIRSLWYLHNESVNIWSHLLGAIAFIIIAPISYFMYLEGLDTIRWTDIAVLYAFLAGAIVCLSMSASFHTFCSHSEKVCSQWICCDYLGIVFLIVGSFYPAIFYGFYCQKTWQIVYIAVISTLGAATIVAVVQPRFSTPQFRWVRSTLFSAVGLSGLCPVIHGIVIYGFPLARHAVALNYVFCMGGSYFFGALIYGSRTPERFFPGKFDYFMSSHQIFHICVLIGCAVHFAGVIEAMTFWHTYDHSCTVPLDQLKAMFAN